MKMKKIIAALILICVISQALLSCGDNNPADDTDNNANIEAGDNQNGGQSGEKADAGDGETRIEPDLPDEDFKGYTFTFLTPLDTGAGPNGDWVHETPLELVADEQMSELINDAVYARNLKIKEKYNIEFKLIAEEDSTAALRRAILADDNLYDAFVMGNIQIQPVITGSMLVRLDELAYIDLSQPWWDPAVNALSIDNQHYLLGGDLLILDNEATNAILFNKNLMASLGMDYPYDLVKENKWTMDTFNEMLKKGTADLNGDGVMKDDDDRWGFVAFYDTLLALYTAGGGALARKDADDLPYIDLISDRGLAVFDKVADIMYNKNDVFNVQAFNQTGWDRWGEQFYGSFEENRALFQWARIRVAERYRGMESEFGIIPLPKYDEAQKSYHSLVNPFTGALLGVPKTAENLERSSIILEALAAESRYTLQPAYYEVALQRKYARDDESAEMLDIIFSTRVYDIGAIYNFSDLQTNFIYLCNTSNRDIASFYEKNIGRLNSAIEKVVGIFQEMD